MASTVELGLDAEDYDERCHRRSSVANPQTPHGLLTIDDEQTPSLPSDPKVRAEIFAGIEQGIAEADAGLGIPWKVVKAEIEALIAAQLRLRRASTFRSTQG